MAYPAIFALGYVSHLYLATDKTSTTVINPSESTVSLPPPQPPSIIKPDDIEASDHSQKLQALATENNRLKQLLSKLDQNMDIPEQLRAEIAQTSNFPQVSKEELEKAFELQYVELIHRSERDGILFSRLQQYLNEDIDYGWAPDAEQAIQDYFQLDENTEHVKNISVSCKTSLCQMTFENTDWQSLGPIANGMTDESEYPFKGFHVTSRSYKDGVAALIMISKEDVHRGFEFYSID